MATEGQEKIKRFLPLFILILSAIVRTVLFGSVPGGINQDEAFAGYEAWCLLNYGKDTAGYSWPVYLTAWGSGMNALESYMMIPFIALFGLETWVIRLPQLIMALLSIWTVYLTVRMIKNENAALAAMALMGIAPWHVMLSRWGLESNLAPAFLLIAFYLFLKAREDSRWLIASALVYGLSLYCYATIWPIVPVLILAQLIFCLRTKQLRADRYMLIAALVLFALALPLMLFMAVNYGVIEEIRTPFFSVPKLLYMRAGEISFKNIPENLKKTLSILVRQNDGLLWNSSEKYGLIYFISLPFALLGLAGCIGECVKKRGEYAAEALLIMQFAAGLILGMLISANVNRINIIFIPIIIFCAYGMDMAAKTLGRKLWIPLVLVYLLLFVGFGKDYFGDYREKIGYYFDEGLEEALDAAEAVDGNIYLPEDIHYPKILFYERIALDDFQRDVEYLYYPAAYLKARSIGRYIFGYDTAEIDKDAAYIIRPWSDLTLFEDEGFKTDRFENFILAYMPD